MDWKNIIGSALKNELPGVISHRKMLPQGRDLSFGQEGQIKKSSVLLLIIEKNRHIYICLIKRPAHMKYHPGQIAFPGGTVEASDASVIDTALRESREELGINTQSLSVLGFLTPLYVSVSKFLIYPVVAWSDRHFHFSVNRNEVERLIFFPLLPHIRSFKIDFENVITADGPLKVPCIRFENEIIWGATGMILAELFDALKTGSQ